MPTTNSPWSAEPPSEAGQPDPFRAKECMACNGVGAVGLFGLPNGTLRICSFCDGTGERPLTPPEGGRE